MKMTQEELNNWNELLIYVEKNIFRYDDNQHLKKNAVLRLKGLQTGKVIANNKIKDNGYYSFEIILLTFKACKDIILRSIENKNFDSEGNKMAYICAIVNSKINDIYERKKKADKAKTSIITADTTFAEYESAEYKAKTKSGKDKKYDDLW